MSEIIIKNLDNQYLPPKKYAVLIKEMTRVEEPRFSKSNTIKMKPPNEARYKVVKAN